MNPADRPNAARNGVGGLKLGVGWSDTLRRAKAMGRKRKPETKESETGDQPTPSRLKNPPRPGFTLRSSFARYPGFDIPAPGANLRLAHGSLARLLADGIHRNAAPARGGKYFH